MRERSTGGEGVQPSHQQHSPPDLSVTHNLHAEIKRNTLTKLQMRFCIKNKSQRVMIYLIDKMNQTIDILAWYCLCVDTSGEALNKCLTCNIVISCGLLSAAIATVRIHCSFVRIPRYPVRAGAMLSVVKITLQLMVIQSLRLDVDLRMAHDQIRLSVRELLFLPSPPPWLPL
jgi:hypothetical protein